MAKKEKKLNTEEALAEVFKISLDYIDKSDKMYMDFLDKKSKFIMDRIALKHEEEPLKFFKKAHKKWELELDELEDELGNVYLEMWKEFEVQLDFYEKLKGN